MPGPLEKEIAVYGREKERLEKEHPGKFVLIYGDDVIDTFDTFDAAATEGLRQFGRGPFLIREVGREKLEISAAVLYGLMDDHIHSSVRIE